ncbi:Zn-ribbon domain-containing OB-fold protein [Sporichthya polymorpha]|uniref:Zn-ribbon domain-containing OB-fold protein n=1 Tax=Sporichthya polymorpha TaxID=35751 RepID=UPI0003A904F5|nr:OB-fold domain-containing protein [Sporichthya polymorpha]
MTPNSAVTTEDPLTAPFWAAARDGRLVVQRCRECQVLRWPPLDGCPECLHPEAEWTEIRPHGEVWSFVVYLRAFSKELAADVPYTVAMVKLDDGPYMVGRLETEEPLTVGDRVEAAFVDGQVRWRRTSSVLSAGARGEYQ